MKIFRICPSTLGGHLKVFRKKFVPKGSSFVDQIEIYRDQNILLPGSWAMCMQSLGYEVFETVYNDIAIQLSWAVEHLSTKELSSIIGKRDVFWEVLKLQVRNFRPEFIYVYAGANLFLSERQRKTLIEDYGVKIANLWGDQLPSNLSYKSLFSTSLINHTSSHLYSENFKKAGLKPIKLGNCFDPETAKNTVVGEKHKYQFTFCGTTGFGFDDHVQRYENLLKFMGETDLHIWTKEPRLSFKYKLFDSILSAATYIPSSLNNFLKFRLRNQKFSTLMQYAEIQRITRLDIARHYLPPSHSHYFRKKSLKQLFPRRVHKPFISAHDYFQHLVDSKFVLNLHREELADIGNIRVFEATGVGSLLCTDRKEGLSEIFDVENDILSFESLEEFREKYDYLSSRPEDVESMSKRAQGKVLSGHTTNHRCLQIDEDIRKALKSKLLPKARTKLLACYDLDIHPLSFDFAFFIQSALIEKRRLRADKLHVRLILPDDLENIDGFSEEANLAVNTGNKVFRVENILQQILHRFPVDSWEVAKRNVYSDQGFDYVYPKGTVHHNSFYRLVNSTAVLDDLRPTREAEKRVNDFLKKFSRPIITITLRQYDFDVERNSNIKSWASFAHKYKDQYDFVIVPDTDKTDRKFFPELAFCHIFKDASLLFDLRLALYEKSYLNMFINNGPCVVSTLSPRVKFLMFKTIVPSVEHCSEEFLEDAGFEIGENPPYLNNKQIYTWKSDTLEEIDQCFQSF